MHGLEGRVNMPGRHNVSNALLAVALLEGVGIDAATALAGIASCRGVPGRMELVSGTAPVRGVVDYAHKPEAISAVLEALRESTPAGSSRSSAPEAIATAPSGP
ncbi:hypothetical protein GCM10029992_59040 [Glycomyces albus]